MLVTLNEVLKDAQEKHYAVGLFNTVDTDMLEAVISTAEQLRSPVIIGTAEVLLPYGELALIAPAMIHAAKNATVPVVVHYDHGVTFEKWSDGSIRLKEVEILPTWVIRETRGGKYVYQIIPLDTTVADWKNFKLTDATVKEAKASYNRTLKLVGTGLNAARAELGLAEVPLTVE